VSGTTQLALMGTYHDGTVHNLSASATWSSANTGIATVQSMGAASPGLVAGVAPGAVTIQGSIRLPLDGRLPYASNQPPPSCFFTAMPTSPGNVVGITGVLPSPLVIGTTGTMTISGSGFSGKGTPTLQFSAAGISAVNPGVVNDSTIQAGYAVSCSAVSQSLTVTFPSFDNVSTNTWPLTVVLPQAPTPTIQLAGNNISGTQSVVVGQQIALSASVSLPACMNFSSQSWSNPPGTAIGGYVNSAGTGPPDTTGGQVAALPPNSTSDPLSLGYTFYWVQPANPLNMTFQYIMSGGFGSVSSPIATASFNVGGPTAPSVSSSRGMWQIQTSTSGPQLFFGFPIGTPGITFTGKATSPSGNAGTYEWAQLVTTNIHKLTSGSTTTTCSTGTGLDNRFPVSTGLSYSDSPATLLQPNYNEETWSLGFTTYFMWRPGLTNDIPIPLGQVTWTAFGDAVQSGGTWNVQSGSISGSDPFQAGSAYPVWTTSVSNGSSQCAPQSQ